MKELILQTLLSVSQKVDQMNASVVRIEDTLVRQREEKEWYSTNELAAALGKQTTTLLTCPSESSRFRRSKT